MPTTKRRGGKSATRKTSILRVPIAPVAPAALVSNEDVVRWSIRLEESIGKLTQATTELAVGVAAQRQRLDYVETQHKQQQDEVRRIAEQHANDYRELSDKLETQTEKLTKHLDESVEKITNSVTDKIAEVTKAREDADKAIEARVNALETWRWILVGGGSVVGLIVTVVFVKILLAVIEANVPAWLSKLF